MNLTSPIEMCSQSTTETWKRVLAGDVEAYEAVVASHQSAVSAVA
ncbi:MAG: hypothetical protein OSA98_11745 [Rubripirellula sp.]|nr:hypothetical protein [Rubripirellula sp.]